MVYFRTTNLGFGFGIGILGSGFMICFVITNLGSGIREVGEIRASVELSVEYLEPAIRVVGLGFMNIFRITKLGYGFGIREVGEVRASFELSVE